MNEVPRKPIWVISKPHEKDAIEHLLKKMGINNPFPKIISSLEFDPQLIPWKEIEFILLDNQSLRGKKTGKDEHGYSIITYEGENLAHYQLMEKTIKALPPNKFIIHFGGIIDLVAKNRNKVHAANSPFALHARIKEMQNFIDVYVTEEE